MTRKAEPLLPFLDDTREVSLYLEAPKFPRAMAELGRFEKRGARGVLTVANSERPKVLGQLKKLKTQRVAVRSADLRGHDAAVKSWLEGNPITALHAEYVRNAATITGKERDAALRGYKKALRNVERLEHELSRAKDAQSDAVANLVRVYGRTMISIGGERHEVGYTPKAKRFFLIRRQLQDVDAQPQFTGDDFDEEEPEEREPPLPRARATKRRKKP